MKHLLIFFTLISMNMTGLFSQQSSDLSAIQTVVTDFMNYGDQQDAVALETILHPEFRTVANRLFGAEEVSLMNKDLYLQLVRDKKIGGDKRQLYILDLAVVGNNATVKAVFEGEILHFTTFITLVKSTKGDWAIIGDFPHIEKV